MSRKTSREAHLEKTADILCRSAYRLCKETFGGKNGSVDAKTLKEVSAAVKETLTVSEGLRKYGDAATAGVLVTVSAAGSAQGGHPSEASGDGASSTVAEGDAATRKNSAETTDTAGGGEEREELQGAIPIGLLVFLLLPR